MNSSLRFRAGYSNTNQSSNENDVSRNDDIRYDTLHDDFADMNDNTMNRDMQGTTKGTNSNAALLLLDQENNDTSKICLESSNDQENVIVHRSSKKARHCLGPRLPFHDVGDENNDDGITSSASHNANLMRTTKRQMSIVEEKVNDERTSVVLTSRNADMNNNDQTRDHMDLNKPYDHQVESDDEKCEVSARTVAVENSNRLLENIKTRCNDRDWKLSDEENMNTNEYGDDTMTDADQNHTIHDTVDEYSNINTIDNSTTAKEERELIWKNFCQEILDGKLNETSTTMSTYQKTVQQFLDGYNRRTVAHEKLVEIYEETEKTLDESIQNTLGIVVPIYELFGTEMKQMERDIVQHFVMNHKQRDCLLTKLQLHDTKWQQLYSSLTQRVLKSDENEIAKVLLDVEPKEHINSNNSSTIGQVTTTMEGKEDNDKDNNEEDPDWNVLLQYESAHGNITTFLQHRERWNAACETFTNALNDIHDELRATNIDILQLVGDAYDTIMNSDLEFLQQDIQDHLIKNYRCRQHQEQVLYEAAQQQQGFFARLMARVVGGGSSSSVFLTPSAAATTTTTTPTTGT